MDKTEKLVIGGMVLGVVGFILLLIFVGGDDRECIRYGAPTYIKSGNIMVPIKHCAEYAPEASAQ